MRIGAHVSTSEALDKCIDRSCEIGAEAMQIFACAPQSWRPVAHADEAIGQLKRRSAECNVAPIFVHGIYLVNLASADGAHLERSVTSLAQCLRFCEAAGAQGVIFHVGSHKGAGFDPTMPQIVRAIQQVLEQAPAGGHGQELNAAADA